MDRYLRRLMGGNFGRVVTVLVVVFAVTAAAVAHELTESDIDNLTDDQLKDAYKLFNDGPIPDADVLRKDVKKFIAPPQPRIFEDVTKFRLNIINGIQKNLVVDRIKGTRSMDSWAFKDVDAAPSLGKFSAVAFYPKFNKRWREDKASAEVHYSIEGTRDTFIISATQCEDKDDEPCLKVQWNVDTSKVAVHPSNLVGVYKDGTFDIILIPRDSTPKLQVTMLYRPSLRRLDVTERAVPWMERHADIIQSLSLKELTLAGTHNSGSVKVEYPDYLPLRSHSVVEQLIGVWAICQDDYIPTQLTQGVRAFDIRIGRHRRGTGEDNDCKSESKGFLFVHGDVPMDIPLAQLKDEVEAFLNSNPYEVIVFDFHALEKTLDPNPSANDFVEVLESLFKDWILPYNTADEGNIPLSQIWGKPKERIAISCKFCPARDWLWPSIPQKWFSSTKTPAELENALTDWYGMTYLGEPHPEGTPAQTGFGDKLFTTCLFTNNLPFPPKWQARELESFIDVWMSVPFWALISNICAVDFIPDMNNIAAASTGASMMKGWRKLNGVQTLTEPIQFSHYYGN